MSKLDEIRDELAGKACVHLIAVDAYKEGWDEAMERAKTLKEALDKIEKDTFGHQHFGGSCEFCGINYTAKSALREFYGEIE